MRNLRDGLFTVLAIACLACIAQKPLEVIFTDSGKGVGIYSGFADKTATTAPATLSSVNNAIGTAVTVLEFTLKENGSRDGYPLQIKELRFVQLGTADIADLRFILEGPGSNNTVATTAGSIVTFKNFGDLIVSDGDTSGKTYQIKVHMRANIQGSLTDNSTILIKTSPLTDFDVTETSSNFLESVSAFQQTASTTVEIIATELQGKNTFGGLTAAANGDFTGTGSVSIYATDANGRTDTNFVSQIDLTARTDFNNCPGAAAGTLSSTDGLGRNAVLGIATWTDLKFNTASTIRIQATSTTNPIPSPLPTALCTGSIIITP